MVADFAAPYLFGAMEMGPEHLFCRCETLEVPKDLV